MVAIERTACYVTTVGERVFYPGANVLTDAEFESIKTHYGFTSEVECGNMKVILKEESKKPSVAESAADKTADEIAGLTEKKAKTVIRKLLDIVSLLRIAQNDPRDSIRTAAKDQITMLRSGRLESTSGDVSQ